jgi:hypothetical protein
VELAADPSPHTVAVPSREHPAQPRPDIRPQLGGRHRRALGQCPKNEGEPNREFLHHLGHRSTQLSGHPVSRYRPADCLGHHKAQTCGGLTRHEGMHDD